MNLLTKMQENKYVLRHGLSQKQLSFFKNIFSHRESIYHNSTKLTLVSMVFKDLSYISCNIGHISSQKGNIPATGKQGGGLKMSDLAVLSQSGVESKRKINCERRLVHCEFNNPSFLKRHEPCCSPSSGIHRFLDWPRLLPSPVTCGPL